MKSKLSFGDIFNIRSALGGDFSYSLFNFGALRFLIELWLFVNNRAKRGVTSPFYFFKLTLDYLQSSDFLTLWDTRDYSASTMINFHLFIALCKFNVRDGLLFLSNNPAWCRMIGFVNGVPGEATVSRFRARMGCDFDSAFADLVKYVIEMTGVEKVNREILKKFNRSFRMQKSFLHISFKSSNLVGPTSCAGLILILHAMYSLGLISIIEGIHAEKSKNATYSTLQISLSILAEMILGVENDYLLEEGLESDALLEIFCTLADGKTPSRTTLNRDIRTRYDPDDVKRTFEALIQWLKVLGLLRVVTIAIDSSKLYVNGKWYENTAKVREQFKTVEGYKLFVVYEAYLKVPIYLEFVPMNTADNTILINLLEESMRVVGKIKRVLIDRGFYDETNFEWMRRHGIEYIAPGKEGTEISKFVHDIPDAKYREERMPDRGYQPKTERGKKKKIERDAKIKPVKLADVMYNGHTRVIAKKVKVPFSKRDKLLRLLTEVLENGAEYSANGYSRLYLQEYNEPFNESKNPESVMRNALLEMPFIEKTGPNKSRKYKINRKNATIKKEPFECGKEVIPFWITNVKPRADSAVQILDEYKNRWSIEIFFRDEKNEDNLNHFPCRSFRGIKTNLYFKFIAFVILFVFKKLLTDKYRNAGLTILRRYIIKQPAVLYYQDGEVRVDMHGKKQKERFNGQLECMEQSIEEIMSKASICEGILPVQT